MRAVKLTSERKISIKSYMNSANFSYYKLKDFLNTSKAPKGIKNY